MVTTDHDGPKLGDPPKVGNPSKLDHPPKLDHPTKIDRPTPMPPKKRYMRQVGFAVDFFGKPSYLDPSHHCNNQSIEFCFHFYKRTNLGWTISIGNTPQTWESDEEWKSKGKGRKGSNKQHLEWGHICQDYGSEVSFFLSMICMQHNILQ